jgi:hypothetical protein
MRGVLYLNRAQVTITKNQMRENGALVFRDDQRMLGWLLHVPRGPFYSPKAARSRWRQSGTTILAFCRVAHRTVRCTTGQALFMVRCRSPSWNGTADRCRNIAVGASTLSGASCRPLERATRRPRIWRPIIALAAVGSPDSPVHHRIVWWIIVVRRRRIPESGQFARSQPGAPDTVRCTTGQSSVPDCVESWLLQPSLFLFLFSLILALRQIYLHTKTNVLSLESYLLVDLHFIYHLAHNYSHNMCWALNHQKYTRNGPRAHFLFTSSSQGSLKTPQGSPHT